MEMLKHTKKMDRAEFRIEAKKLGITNDMEIDLYALVRLLITVESEGFSQAVGVSKNLSHEEVLQYIKDGHAAEPYKWLRRIGNIGTMKVAFGISRCYLHLIGYLVRDRYDITEFARGVTEGHKAIGAPIAAQAVYKLFSLNIKLNKKGRLGGSKLKGWQRKSILVQGFNAMFEKGPLHLDKDAPIPELHGI